MNIILAICFFISGITVGNIIRIRKINKILQEIRRNKEDPLLKVGKIQILMRFDYFFW